ncbi:MAG: alpha/beta hydrolase, partial [Candidatus Bathyarchaeia archaeon]
MLRTQTSRTVKIPVDVGYVEGILQLPTSPCGIVLFAHGSGSGRHSVRNNFVAGVLRDSRIATLLFDLLTEDEALDRRNVFNINLLAERLLYATEFTRQSTETKALSIGYFGASTGAAAAIQASVMTE